MYQILHKLYLSNLNSHPSTSISSSYLRVPFLVLKKYVFTYSFIYVFIAPSHWVCQWSECWSQLCKPQQDPNPAKAINVHQRSRLEMKTKGFKKFNCELKSAQLLVQVG